MDYILCDTHSQQITFIWGLQIKFCKNGLDMKNWIVQRNIIFQLIGAYLKIKSWHYTIINTIKFSLFYHPNLSFWKSNSLPPQLPLQFLHRARKKVSRYCVVQYLNTHYGASEWSRTINLLITSQLLCH